jgi:HemK-related putative methylase
VVRYNFPEYKIELEISKDIYFPAEDTFFLIESINLADHHFSIVEIGGGSGIISIVLAQKNPKARFIVTDLAFNSTKTIRTNCRINKVEGQIDPICMDKIQGFRFFSPEYIIWNPPYLPTDEESRSLPQTEKIMLLGGKKGYEEIYSLIEYLSCNKLKTKLITVFSSLAWDVKMLKIFHKKDIKAEIINEKKLFFEKLYLVIFDFSDNNVDR